MNGTRHLHRCALKVAPACCNGFCNEGRECPHRKEADPMETTTGRLISIAIVLTVTGVLGAILVPDWALAMLIQEIFG